MPSRINTHRQLFPVGIGLLAFILSGCRTDITFEIHTDGSIKSTIIAEDTDDSMRKIRQYCPALHIRMKPLGRFIEAGTMEDITPPGGHTRCKLTSNEKVSNDTLVRDHGKTYEFILTPAEKEGRVSNEGFNATTVFVMPGKVVKTSIGHAEGNKVTVKSMNYISTGFSITWQKGERSSAGSASAKVKGASGTVGASSSSSRDESGFPWWGWTGIGAGLIAAVGGAAIVAGRRKHKATATGYPPNAMTAGQYPGRHISTPNMSGPDMSGTYGTLHSPSHNGYGQQTAPTPTHDPHAAPSTGKQPGDPHDQFRPR